MKKLPAAIVAIIIVLSSWVPASAQTPAASSYSATPFSLTFVGTRYRSDVETIIANLEKSPKLKSLSPRTVSQNNIRYAGTFEGPADGLSFDIRSLCADRFAIAESAGTDGSMEFTLSKLKDTSASY